MSLSNRVALVTGASSGIGAAVAKSLIERGARVVISDINAQGGALLQRELGPKCYFIKSDMSQASDREKLVEEAQKWAKETATASGEGENGENDTAVTILINNAGIQHVDPVERFPLSKWSFIMELMLTAPFHLSQLVLPSLYTAGYGRIINIGSIHSLVASVGKAAYVSAKHGLLGLTKTLALEMAQHGSNITSNCICPSYVETALVRNQLPGLAATHNLSESEVLQKILLANVPQGRLIQPSEIGGMVGYLCGEEARAVTGAALQIDCGWTAR